MRMFWTTFLLWAALVVIASSATVERRTYIVHMDNKVVAALDESVGETKRWYNAVMESIAEYSPQGDREEEAQFPQLLYVYHTAMSGFSATLSEKELESLKGIDGFLHAMPDEILSLHTTRSPQFLGLQRGKGLWKAPNMLTDVIVGVVDTGIWPEHISFRDTGMPPVPARWKGACQTGTRFSSSNCNKKIIGARAFFKSYEATAGRINETHDYRSPRDSIGHGTHTASTIAGNIVRGASLFGLGKGSAGGMSYTSRIAVYRVCWIRGCANADILAAMDQAIADGVDILSISLGGFSSNPYYSDNMAIAAFGAIQKGVFVSCSAGNFGPTMSTVVNAAPWIMTVAASYMDRKFPTTVKLGNGLVFEGASLYSGKQTKMLPLVYGKNAGGQGAEFCNNGSLIPKLVKGKIVVCDRGEDDPREKGERVKMAGGSGMLLLNTEDDGEELFADPHVLPASSLGATAARTVKSYASLIRKPKAMITFQGTVYGNPAPVMAAFSSRGPSKAGPDVIKPDVTAPGVNILAAWPPTVSPAMLNSDKRRSQFGIFSGTSMSCPHVSGLAALLKAVHKDWSPAAIKSALMTTAYTENNQRTPIADMATETLKSATPFAFGSGHVDPERASDPGLIYDINADDYLNYLCSLNYNSTQITLLARKRFRCPSRKTLQPGDLNYPSFALSLISRSRNATSTYRRTVTNVGVPDSRYTAEVSEPDGVSIIVEPKALNFQKLGQKVSYKVSFVALGGNSLANSSSFGSLTWVSGTYSVRSPIAVSWHQV